jgi:hypothetical protein
MLRVSCPNLSAPIAPVRLGSLRSVRCFNRAAKPLAFGLRDPEVCRDSRSLHPTTPSPLSSSRPHELQFPTYKRLRERPSGVPAVVLPIRCFVFFVLCSPRADD